jgi:hypothetical protein
MMQARYPELLRIVDGEQMRNDPTLAMAGAIAPKIQRDDEAMLTMAEALAAADKSW